MKNNLECLRQLKSICPLTTSIDKDQWDKAIASGLIYTRQIGSMEILHMDGDSCDDLEIVIQGEFTVDRIDLTGKLLTVTEFRKASTIGANLIFSTKASFPMTVTAKSPAMIMVIKRDLVLASCKNNEIFLTEYLKIISDHTVFLGQKVKHQMNKTIRESMTLMIRKEYISQQCLTINLSKSKKAIAESLGVSRTSLSRELQKMKKDGIIDFTRNTITILDPNLINFY